MSAYDVLGITPDATSQELEAAYQARRAAYHPGRLAGLGNELLEHAQRRTVEIEVAYRSLRPALALPPRLTPHAEQRRDRETMIVLLCFLSLALAALGLRDVAVPERTVAVEGADVAQLMAQQAPDFTLQTLDGQSVSLAQFRGEVVLVNLWATWCPPCVREVPSLVRIYDQYRGQGFVILGVNTTYQDDPAKVAQFVQDQQMHFPILLDTTGETGGAYGSRLMPTSYLIDRDGKIVYTHVGQIDEKQLSERIAALLAQPKSP